MSRATYRPSGERRGSADSSQTDSDIGALVNGDSFSDLNSGDDSNSWMQRIDVSNFRKLTSDQENKQLNMKLECKQEEADCKASPDMDEDKECPIMLDHGGYVSSTKLELIKAEPEDNRRPTALAYRDRGLLAQRPQHQSFPSPADSQQSVASIMDCDYPLVADTGSRPPPRGHGSHVNVPQQRSIFVHGNNDCVLPAAPLRMYPKPIYSYSCLIALSLKNSNHGKLTVAEIYNFMCENFPYFRTAPAGWKNSVRHNLSLNKCFEKIEIEAPGGHGRKSCLWTLNPNKKNKMDQEIRKWRDKDPEGVREALLYADELELIERGGKGIPCESNPFWMQPTPTQHDFHSQQSQQQLLVVRSNSMPEHAKYASAPTINPAQQQCSSAWPSQQAAKVARLASQPVLVDSGHDHNMARAMYHSPSHSQPLAHGQAQYGTPHRHQQIGASVQQSSPFSHTPPYSPTVGDPPQQPAVHWAQHQAPMQHSTPVKYQALSQPPCAYSPYALSKLTGAVPQGGSPSHGLFTAYQPHMDQQYASPCKLLNTSFGTSVSLGLGMMGPYEATQSALHNNSLLQSPHSHTQTNMPLTLHTL